MTNPVSPTGTATTTADGRRPGTVEAAFWLYLIAPVVGLILAIVGIGAATNAGNAAAAKAGVSTAAVSGLIVASIVLNVVLLVAVIVIDLFFRRGANWARIVMTVLGVLSFFAGGFLTFVISLVAIILSWLPASNAWFRSVRGTAAPRTV
ncbi:hypothetical protein [Amnibacterium sp.]|jgi:hypothetical protein|uniref:hypothetical protein n=1 Tax=Amnibacterium sp. TaxID=1872496 RepID=UPI00260D3C44|nr:hypothetical protein [Amnibacterium sp.]MCU1474994.1 hypothetical protein [Amnibacterium sp.]